MYREVSIALLPVAMEVVGALNPVPRAQRIVECVALPAVMLPVMGRRHAPPARAIAGHVPLSAATVSLSQGKDAMMVMAAIPMPVSQHVKPPPAETGTCKEAWKLAGTVLRMSAHVPPSNTQSIQMSMQQS